MNTRLLKAPEMRNKLSKIKLLVLDVDGIMTDGQIFWTSQGWSRKFCVKDGYGIKLLIENGLDVAVITGAKEVDVKERVKMLGIQYAYYDCGDKREALDDLLSKTKVSADQAAYMGDELIDLPVIEKVGLSFSVESAVREVKKRVDYVVHVPAGRGAVREVVDAIRYTQKIGPYIDLE